MADQPANGTEAKVVDLHAMRDRGRAAFMGAFQSGGELADVAPTETEPKPAAKTEAEPAAPASTPAKKTAPVDDFADDAPAADDEFADEPAEREVDADTRRRIERVQQTEAKSREALARKEAELERKYAADRADAEAFRKLKARARYAPGDVLAELDPDLDWDFASKDAFARTKAAADDPKWRDAARSMSKGREQDDKLGLALKRIEALESEVKTHREAAQAERQIEQYFDKATKLVSPEVSPLLAKQLAKNPEGARERLNAIAREGLERTGKLPPQEKLLKIYERRRRAELEELDIDVDALVGKKKEQTLAAAKDHAAATNSTTASSAAGAAVPGDRRAGKAAFLKSDVS